MILHYSDIDKNKWGSFVKSHPLGNIFQTPEMFQIYLKQGGNQPLAIALTDENEELQGILLAIVISKGLFTKWFTSRSIIIGGPLASEDNASIVQQLVDEYKRVLPKYVVYTEIRPVYSIESIESSLMDNHFIRIGHYNLFLDISPDKAILWDNLHKERKRNIKKALASGLVFQEVTSEDDILKIVNLIRSTYKRKRVPLTNYDTLLNARSVLKQNIRFFAVFYNGQIIAGQVRLCYSSLIYAWYAGSDEAYLKLYPNDFLMWNVICWSHDAGYRVFDFGGGGEPGIHYGVRDYKLKYGCEMRDFGRFQIRHHPLIYKLGAFAIKHFSKR